jgi:acyl carrier protein
MNSFTPNSKLKADDCSGPIQDWLVAQIAEQLSLEPEEIDIHSPISEFGLESLQAMLIVSRAEKTLGVKIPPTLVWNYPTIELLSQRLADQLELPVNGHSHSLEEKA